MTEKKKYLAGDLARAVPVANPHHRALDIVLLQGPRRTPSLMSEVALYLASDLSRAVPVAEAHPVHVAHLV